jgi:glycosyltransferase involved in cell wall biosynthesis
LTIEKILARTATDRIVVISRQQYREIHEQFGVGRAGQFKVIPLGLELGAFAGWRERREAARAELGAVGARDILVGIVGRLTEIKNHKLFIKAAAMYLERHASPESEAHNSARHVRFVIIGDGHLRPELEMEARAFDIEEHVIFTGMRADPENFYAALDICALTSLNEGTPLTLIEAMANARPVVATAVGGVVDLLGDAFEVASLHIGEGGKNLAGTLGYTFCERGVRVRTNDAEAFCEALAFLIADEDLRREMGERGQAFVAEHYSKERLVKDVLNLYSELSPSPRVAAVAAKQGSVSAIESARVKGD